MLVANLKALQVSVSVPESDIGSLKVGQKATVTFPAVDDAEASGTITSIDPVATTSNSVVTYGVVVRLSGVPSTVRLGQSASVTVTTDSATGVLVVPSTAVTTTGDRSTVTVLAERRADADGRDPRRRRRPLDRGRLDGAEQRRPGRADDVDEHAPAASPGSRAASAGSTGGPPAGIPAAADAGR